VNLEAEGAAAMAGREHDLTRTGAGDAKAKESQGRSQRKPTLVQRKAKVGPGKKPSEAKESQ
jgi:hypothetical protein